MNSNNFGFISRSSSVKRSKSFQPLTRYSVSRGSKRLFPLQGRWYSLAADLNAQKEPAVEADAIPKTVAHRGKEVTFGYREAFMWEKLALLLLTTGLTLIRAKRDPKLQQSISSSKYLISGFHISLQFVLAGALLRLMYQNTLQLPKLVNPKAVSFENSHFQQFEGLNVHSLRFFPDENLEASSDGGPPVFIHCNHGFGASALSYCDVGHQLANKFKAAVMAHDTPGFGLTERPSRQDSFKYLLEYNAEIGLHQLGEANSNLSTGEEEARFILFGHSMGALTTVRMALRLPPEKTTVVLISPALQVPLTLPATLDGESKPLVRFFLPLKNLASALMFRLILPLVKIVVYPLLIGLLRPLVYEAKFWQDSLRKYVWHKPDEVRTDTVNRYRWPSLVEKWDRGMARFCLKPQKTKKVQEKLQETAEKNFFPLTGCMPTNLIDAMQQQVNRGLKVLIIHGANDNLVPIWNSKRIAKLHPSIQLFELEKCGHVAHEEKPDEFLSIVTRCVHV